MAETNRYTLLFLAISCGLFSIAVGLSRTAFNFYNADQALAYVVALLLVSVPFVVFGSICFALSWLPISSHHTVSSAISHFVMLIMMCVIGYVNMYSFEKASRNPRERQRRLLMQILKDNADTEYGKLMGFADIKDPDDFRAKHPLTMYETYKPYVDRIAEKGEQNLLTRDIVTKFNASSGTTGKVKLLPSTSGYYNTLLMNALFPYFYILTQFKRGSFFAPLKTSFQIFVPNWKYTPSNIPIGPMTAFPKKQRSLLFTLNRTLPVEAEVFMNENGQCYLHWLFALYDRNLVRIDAAYAGILVWWMEMLQKLWPRLVADIRRGKIDRTSGDIPVEIIERLEKAGKVWADPKRADELEAEFSKGFEGIISRIFPRLNLATSISTGAQAVYVDRIKWHCGPGVKVYSPIFGASEPGLMGLNIDVDDTEQLYTLLPQMSFMEFIPDSDVDEKQPKTFLMEQLEVGKRYELVVTTIGGFYRYRMGDILEIARLRYGKTPVVRFCSRTGTLLDMRGEKTSEDHVFAALKKASAQWSGFQGLEDYTTTEAVSFAKVFPEKAVTDEDVLRYILFVEVNGVARQLTPEEVAIFDECLQEVALAYKSMRSRTAIYPPKVCIVKKGTFTKMRVISLAKTGAISNQYKTPRYLSDADRLRFLVDSSYN